MHLASSLLATTNVGSPAGVTTQDKWFRELWHVSFWFAIPVAVIVVGGIAWCLIRYRARPERPDGTTRHPAQFQYHIPIEAAYTIIPLIIVAVIFGFMFNAENKVDAVSKTPAVKIDVEGFQWGWRFVYPNGHQQVGTVSNELDINNNTDLPVLVLPTNETVQLHVVSLDVVHTFYVKEFLFNRDLIPGIDNVFDVNVTQTGIYQGQCNNICGQYHAYMRFLVDVMTPSQYGTWYAQQPSCSVTTAGGASDQPGACEKVPQS
jgi:cytochrome c oxidase subunit 2